MRIFPITIQRFLTLASLSLPLLSIPARAFLQLGAPFGDHMVLQQGVPVDIWGTGAPGGDTVKLSIAGQSVIATSDWEGRWIVHLAPMKAGGPYQLLIEIGGVGPLIPSSAANSKGGAELNDVLIGDVVLASSSSRASASTSTDNSASQSESHPYAWVRVYKSASATPATTTPEASGHWIFVSPQDIAPPDALFAVGGDLYTKRHIPIGVVEASNGPICTDPAACPSPAPHPSEGPRSKSPKGNETP
jgi:sialate O-acetylesterase